MFIINKKRLVFIELSLIFSIIFASITNTNFSGNTISVSSTPVTGHIVTLDAGHGNPDGGAENEDGLTEANINLEIVLKLQKFLEASDCTVILTRSDENGIYDIDSKTLKEKKVSDMKNRAKIGNSSDSEIFVSIHLNKIAQSKYYGCIQIENKRQPQTISGKYIIENVKIPTVIVECGFLSNPNEAKLLEQEDYQEKIAWGIYTGIMDYFENNN